MLKLKWRVQLVMALVMLFILSTSSGFAASDPEDSVTHDEDAASVFLPLITTNDQTINQTINQDNNSEDQDISIDASSLQICTACQLVFRDSFSKRVPSARWTWVDPDSDVTHTTNARAGYMRFSTESPNGNNLAPGLLGAPRLLLPYAGNSFRITTRVAITPVHDYQGAGLLIWQDSNNFIRLERGLGLNGQGVYFAKNDAGTFGYQFAATEATTLRLRLQRNGPVVLAWMKEESGDWKVIGAVNALSATSAPQQKVGLIMVSDFASPPTTADFDYFSLTVCLDNTGADDNN